MMMMISPSALLAVMLLVIPSAAFAPATTSSRFTSSSLTMSSTLEPAATTTTTTTATTTTEATNYNKVMWTPSHPQDTAMFRFQQYIATQTNNTNGSVPDDTPDYSALYRYSVDQADDFWVHLLAYLELEYEGSVTPVKTGTAMPDVAYFPKVRLNFAQNLLRHARDDTTKHNEALVSIIGNAAASPEDPTTTTTTTTQRWTFAELQDDAARMAHSLRAVGVTADAACGAYLPNVGETVVAMLGTTAVGSIWTSCSPDFGPQAVVDRFRQVQPKVLFVANGFVSKGRAVSMVEKVEELVANLPSVQQVVVVEVLKGDDQPIFTSPAVTGKMITYDDFLAQANNKDGAAPEPEYTLVPFGHPQFVLYSSGTTGLPKSIAHGSGNTLLTHAKELMLHSDLKQQDRMLFFTTCGWMMWNWMTSSLVAGATVVCFDGFAAYPKLSSPWDVVEAERITHMGTTPRYLQSCRARIRPGENNNLEALRVILSTGSPLAPEDFDYVYDKVKSDVLLASISGGTDICSCFALGNPLLPVRQSEIQAFGLGLDVCALDRDTGKSVIGEKGELVCKSPFVAAPVCFFGDDDSKSKYRGAYFEGGDDDENYDSTGYWYHGDLVEVTGSVGDCGGVVIHGRSDTTLKPGGVRIGTAEVYRFAEEPDIVEDSLVIGDQIKTGKRAGDVRIVLFVKLAEEGMALTADMEQTIRDTIREGASASHVPALIKQVQKIPYTKSGKKVEIAVRDLFAGDEPKNMGALQDPSAFDEYRAMAEEGL